MNFKYKIIVSLDSREDFFLQFKLDCAHLDFFLNDFCFDGLAFTLLTRLKIPSELWLLGHRGARSDDVST